MTGRSQLKVTVHMSGTMMEEIQAEARRQDRSYSWLVQQAWKLSRRELRSQASQSAAVEQLAKRAR